MEAYNVKYGTKVIVTDNEIKTPPSSIPINKGDEITILSLDGMYCNGLNKDGQMECRDKLNQLLSQNKVDLEV